LEEQEQWRLREEARNPTYDENEYNLRRGDNFDDQEEQPEPHWYDGLDEDERNDAYWNID
jgi:hypothetical protein